MQEQTRKPPETLYEWMRDRYLERMEKARAKDPTPEENADKRSNTPDDDRPPHNQTWSTP